MKDQIILASSKTSIHGKCHLAMFSKATKPRISYLASAIQRKKTLIEAFSFFLSIYHRNCYFTIYAVIVLFIHSSDKKRITTKL